MQEVGQVRIAFYQASSTVLCFSFRARLETQTARFLRSGPFVLLLIFACFYWLTAVLLAALPV